ncbi:hypothetical protein CJF30_00001002 [Rutstroemia sp. NJR-2017a BBW]|nr:hypothetical protein CJF30_00001002 [Rutstroemia sp. NJR-2017a BBW]
MEIPRRGQRPSMALPEIYVHDSHPSDRYRQSSRSNSIHSIISPSSAMPIPHAREAIPPPLPPPRHIADIAENGSNGTDIAWKWGNPHQELDWGRSVSSGQVFMAVLQVGAVWPRDQKLRVEEVRMQRSNQVLMETQEILLPPSRKMKGMRASLAQVLGQTCELHYPRLITMAHAI